ncbi:ABC transporter substrate-binding protein [Nonomuraea angiospora]|uniref:ABC transporter substrate-binding protein n=1 Tax=Nonomuraea angiospora TaxID=46172 RepID=UPI00343C8C23
MRSLRCLLGAATVAVTLGLTACSGGGAPLTASSAAPGGATSASSTGGGDRLLNVYNGGSGQFTLNLNPLAQGTPILTGARGMIYETLMFFNQAKADDVQPVLATGYKVGDDGESITFTLREGVKWSDGKPFTAEDVAFNFRYRRDHEELNTGGAKIEDAKVLSPTQVKISFAEKIYMQVWQIAGKTYMLPKHIWEKIDDPVKRTNDKPIGTGPFLMGDFVPESYTMLKNPNYWDTGKPKIAGVRFWTFNNNESASQALLAGKLDWAGIWMPDPDKQYVAKDPEHNHYNNDSFQYITNLVPNLTKAPMNELAVRQAVNAAIDREQLIKLAFAGLGTSTTLLELPQPVFQDYVSPKYVSAKLEHDPAKAMQILTAAGYTKDGEGYFAKNGKRLTITCHVVSGWSDFISAMQVIKQQLKEVGIEFKSKAVSFSAYTDIGQKGDFQMFIGNAWGGPHPYFFYDNILHSNGFPPKKQNMARYKNKAVDDALNTIKVTPPEQQNTVKQALFTIQDHLVADIPYIPLQQPAGLTNYRTQYFTGFPTEDSPYAATASGSDPDVGIVAKTVEPVK